MRIPSSCTNSLHFPQIPLLSRRGTTLGTTRRKRSAAAAPPFACLSRVPLQHSFPRSCCYRAGPYYADDISDALNACDASLPDTLRLHSLMHHPRIASQLRGCPPASREQVQEVFVPIVQRLQQVTPFAVGKELTGTPSQLRGSPLAVCDQV